MIKKQYTVDNKLHSKPITHWSKAKLKLSLSRIDCSILHEANFKKIPALIFLCCCCCGRMGLVFRVTVAIPEGGERGVFGRIGCGWPAGVPWGDVFACIWALMVAPVTDWMWVIGTKLPGIWGREGILLEVVNIEYCFSTLVRGKVLCRILEVNWQNYRSNEQKFWS